MTTKKSSSKSIHYVPHTPKIEQEMLKVMGVSSFEDLLAAIPEEIRLKTDLPLPEAKSEMEVIREMESLSGQNLSGTEVLSFLGGGAYDHFIPSAVPFLASRSEFVTAYTPYQAEVSQGTLQTIYEYQSMICEITEMEVANASLYDGASAVAEACLMAGRINRKTEVWVSDGLYKNYFDVIQTYLKNSPLELKRIPSISGVVDINWLKDNISQDVSAVVVQSPNRFGLMEKWKEAGKICSDHSTLFVAVGDPISFGMFAPPGECGADVYAGEGQGLGTPLSMGGPYLGIFATKMEYVRKVPGRLTAAAVDVDGKPGFVLALQTREQHIRRERATSNICTNQGLVALMAAIYLALLGKEGFKEVANLCFQKSHYLANEIEKISGFSLPFGKRFFKEFVVKCPVASQTILQDGFELDILAGTTVRDDPHYLRIAVTEKRTRKEIDTFIKFLKGYTK